MRIFKTFAVALVLVLVFAFVLNKKLDAGDRETAKLEKKLETALTAIDRLEKAAKKAAKDALKREKELVKRGENLAKQMSAKLKELASLVAADMDQIGEDMKKELVPAMTKLVLPLNKRNRELAAELDNLHKYDKELAAWLKQRDKELVVALTEDLEKYDKERVGALEKELELVAPLVVALDKYDKELAAELDKLGLDMTEHVRIGWLNQKLDELRAYQKLLETGLRWRITNHTHEVTGSPLNREAYPCFPNQLCP